MRAKTPVLVLALVLMFLQRAAAASAKAEEKVPPKRVSSKKFPRHGNHRDCG